MEAGDFSAAIDNISGVGNDALLTVNDTAANAGDFSAAINNVSAVGNDALLTVNDTEPPSEFPDGVRRINGRHCE